MNFKNTFVLNNYMLQSSYFLFNLFKKYNICTEKHAIMVYSSTDYGEVKTPVSLPLRKRTGEERRSPEPASCSPGSNAPRPVTSPASQNPGVGGGQLEQVVVVVVVIC